MKSKSLYSLSTMFLACLIFAACNKAAVTKTTDYTDASSSYSSADNVFKDLNKVLTDAAAENNLEGKKEGLEGTSGLCATVTLSPNDFTTFPKTVTVDFGSTGCIVQYGVFRQGKVTAVFSDYLHNAGAHVAVTFQNYKVNGSKVEGLYTLANTSPNSTTRTFTDTATNGKVTTIDNKVCTWNSIRTSVQSAGFNTPAISDDEYTVQANSNGVGFNGKSYVATSTNVLWKLNCRYLVSGNVIVNSNNDPKDLIIDFGSGACDNKYTADYDIYHADLQFYY